MSHFNQLAKFEKEFSKLSKKYSSLIEDLKKFEKLIEINPTGIGKNFAIIYNFENIKVIKARLTCKSLRNRSMRLIYVYHINTITFVYLELYYKGYTSPQKLDSMLR